MPAPRRHAPAFALAAVIALAAASARADSFAAGSLIIPMDTDYQDMGMLEAYGLVYALLREGVPVRWVVKAGKGHGEVDFTVAATDVRTKAAIPAHGYRGGPWVIDAGDADAAGPVIDAWLAANPNTTVHAAAAAFEGDVSRHLVAAPTIAMMADGNQKIARKYMLAAKIPDSVGDLGWPDTSPDMLTPEELSGPDPNNHHDGQLFDEDGDPVYCQFMSMHWGVKDALANPGAVAEVREFLTHPTHFFAECQAVNAFENHPDHGFFLTESGFLIGKQPTMYDFYQDDTPFAQIDGAFLSVGGSEPAYSLPPGKSYKASDIVMITEKGTPIGVNDVWMTGDLDGLCPASGGCLTTGKVSYLGGHEYSVTLPMSKNPTSQGARLFLNSLFEAPCATLAGLPEVVLEKDAPAVADGPQVTFTLNYANYGPTTALAAVIRDAVPPGATFVSASDGGVFENGAVSWSVGNLGDGEAGTVSFVVELGDFGVYKNVATVDYKVGLNAFSAASNETSTLYGDGDTTGGTGGTGGSGETGGTGGASETGTSGSASGTGGGDASAGDGSAGSASGSSTGSSDSGGASGTGGDSDPAGCGCRGAPASPGAALLVALLALGRPRRRAPRRR